MKSLLFKIPKTNKESLMVQIDNAKDSFSSRHYHPELQITLVKLGNGTQFIGDSIEQYKQGDIFIIGPNLPHVFRPSNMEDDEGSKAHLVSIYFNKDVFGEQFYKLPELLYINKLLKSSKRGLTLKKEIKSIFKDQMEKLINATGFDRVLKLLELLNMVANPDKWNYISSMSFSSPQKDSDNETINTVFEFLMNNYNADIQLNQVANLANLSPNSFCRYFRSRTQNTFTEFLMKIRIGHASRLLIEKDLSIAEIAYLCGFNNLSNFNRQFRKINNCTPSEYKKEQVFN